MTRRHARIRRRSGFTLIEVMIAAGLIMFGAVGIFALQQAATRGNREARALSTASAITQSWLERLDRQSVRWTQNTIQGTANIPYLSPIANQAQTSGWFIPQLPANSTDVEQPGRDWFGNETARAADWRYCTLVRLTWLGQFTSIRADVITWWQKDRQATEQLFPSCGVGGTGAPIVTEIESSDSRLRAVYGSTVIRWSPIQ